MVLLLQAEIFRSSSPVDTDSKVIAINLHREHVVTLSRKLIRSTPGMSMYFQWSKELTNLCNWYFVHYDAYAAFASAYDRKKSYNCFYTSHSNNHIRPSTTVSNRVAVSTPPCWCNEYLKSKEIIQTLG